MTATSSTAPVQRGGAQAESPLRIVSQRALRRYTPRVHWSSERDYRLLMLRHHREALDTLAERLEEKGLSRLAAEALLVRYVASRLPADSQALRHDFFLWLRGTDEREGGR